jgi:CBS domain containing-hemolysin-like protein
MNTKDMPVAEPASAERDDRSAEDGQSTSAGQQAGRTSILRRLSAAFRPRGGSSIRENLEDALAGQDVGGESFSPGERAMLNNILRLREVRVEDVMVPRADIEALEIDTTIGELLVHFERSGHSRMPVYKETLDDPRGMVHIRDVLAYIARSAKAKKPRSRKPATGTTLVAAPTQPAAGAFDLANVDLSKSIGDQSLIRPVLFVPPSMLASDLMTRMQASRIQMALVIDEYGGTDGLVSLEDIVEMVVGDIEDEHDEDEPMITKTGDGVFIVDAKAEIDEVAEVIGGGFAAGEHGEYVDTIGGILFNSLGRVPTRGEVVQAIPGFEFHVLDADPRRVKRVRIVQSRGIERRRRPQRNAAPRDPEVTEEAAE